jgi:hypothetical protein
MKKTLLSILTILTLTYTYGQNYQSADSLVIKDLIIQIKSLQDINDNNTKTVKALLSGREYDAQTKYNIIKFNLINAVETFQLLSDKTTNLKSRNSTNSFDILIKELNNPQSEALGFNFNETLLKLVNEHIQPKKKNVAKNILEAVEGITQSPIITSIPTFTPAISISNSVIGVLRSTSIFDDKVDNQKIKNFETALNNYIQYYSALSDANQGFKFNLEHQKEELGILQQNIYEQVIFFARTLKFQVQPKGPNEDVGEYLNVLFKSFNKSYVENIFTELEKEHTEISQNTKKIKYDEILKNQYLKDANNRLEEFISLTTQFEFKYTEYFNILEQYNTRIIKALDIAKTNKIATSGDVDNKKIEFENKKKESISDIKTSINIDQLKNSKQKINYTARII